MLNLGDILFCVNFLKISVQNGFISSICMKKCVEMCGTVPALCLLSEYSASEFEQGEFVLTEGKVRLGTSKQKGFFAFPELMDLINTMQ